MEFFPKGYDLGRYTQKYIDKKVDLINNRPRKKFSESIIEAYYSAHSVLKRAENGDESVTHTPSLTS